MTRKSRLGQARCDNCGWVGPKDQTRNPIPDLAERLDPGGPMPVGECPQCGALAYEIAKDVVRVDGIYGNQFLQLGAQSNPDSLFQDVHWKCNAWAPKRAKSYSILRFRHTDYHGREVQGVTGYAEFRVQYYGRRDDGMYPVVAKEDLRSTVCNDSDPTPGDDATTTRTPSGGSSSTKTRRKKPAVRKS